MSTAKLKRKLRENWHFSTQFHQVICVKSGSDPHGTPNADGSGVRKGGVRGAELNTGVVFGRGVHGGISMDARIRLRVDKHAGGP